MAFLCGSLTLFCIFFLHIVQFSSSPPQISLIPLAKGVLLNAIIQLQKQRLVCGFTEHPTVTACVSGSCALHSSWPSCLLGATGCWVSMVCHRPSLTQAEAIQTLKQNRRFQSSALVCVSGLFSLLMQISHAAGAQRELFSRCG